LAATGTVSAVPSFDSRARPRRKRPTLPRWLARGLPCKTYFSVCASAAWPPCDCGAIEHFP